MTKTRFKQANATALALTLAATGTAGAVGNPFVAEDVGAARLADAAPAGVPAQLRAGGISVLEGKCGEGKCGSQRVRGMMDADADGTISRREYNQWINREAGSQFDRIDVDRDGIISRGEMTHFDAGR